MRLFLAFTHSNRSDIYLNTHTHLECRFVYRFGTEVISMVWLLVLCLSFAIFRVSVCVFVTQTMATLMTIWPLHTLTLIQTQADITIKLTTKSIAQRNK